MKLFRRRRRAVDLNEYERVVQLSVERVREWRPKRLVSAKTFRTLGGLAYADSQKEPRLRSVPREKKP